MSSKLSILLVLVEDLLCVKLEDKIENPEDHLREIVNTNLDQEYVKEKPMTKDSILSAEQFQEDKQTNK